MSNNASANNAPPKQQKSMTKAERRAVQDAQRAAKAEAKTTTTTTTNQTNAPQKPAEAKPKQKPQKPKENEGKTAALAPATTKQSTQSSTPSLPVDLQPQRNKLFSHLEEYVHQDEKVKINPENIHPAMLQLGQKYANGSIVGSTARTVALLHALREVVQDYSTPKSKELRKDLDSKLKPMIDYIKQCRPMSISMGNALKYFKMRLHKVDPMLTDQEAKSKLLETISTFIDERVVFTTQQIVAYGVEKIKDGDVVMTFAKSQVVERILVEAKQHGKQFSVIVVDSAPKHEGKLLLQALAAAGVKISLALLHAVPNMMKGVSKVLLGAHALFSNGTMMSRVGSAAIAMTAHAYNVPVLVCCETHKFSERSQLDSITRNELADPRELVHQASDWKSANSAVLNLVYDVTPMEYIDMIISEVGQIPPTSVAVVLREQQQKEL